MFESGINAISGFGRLATLGFSALGSYLIFCKESFRRMVFPLVDRRLLLQQMEFVGVRSFWIIVMAAVMVGAVFGIQFGKIFKNFGTESLIGAAAAFALSKELAPVIGSFLVTGRSGSAMAAEIANMKVNEQIDAMAVMSVNPIGYLCSPRILASMLMMPLLSGLFVLVGVMSAYFVGVTLFEIDTGLFIDKIQWISKPSHIIEGLEKAMIFGAVFSSIGCYKGFNASGGAKGVGRATTSAVVISLVVILVSDFFISYAQLEKLFNG